MKPEKKAIHVDCLIEICKKKVTDVLYIQFMVEKNFSNIY